jgi:hypothetical protein
MIGGFLGDLSNHDWGFMGDLSNHDWGFMGDLSYHDWGIPIIKIKQNIIIAMS